MGFKSDIAAAASVVEDDAGLEVQSGSDSDNSDASDSEPEKEEEEEEERMELPASNGLHQKMVWKMFKLANV